MTQCWVLLCLHLRSNKLFSTLLLCSYNPYKYKNRTRGLSARVPVFCTLLGLIYLMVFICAVLMPWNYIALLNSAVVGETIIKDV